MAVNANDHHWDSLHALGLAAQNGTVGLISVCKEKPEKSMF